MAIAPGRTIAELDQIVEALPHVRRSLFERIFDVRVSHGRLLPPSEMEPWIIKQLAA